MSGRTSNLGVAPAFAHSQSTEQFCYHNAGASGLGGSSYIDDTVLRDRDTDANGTLDERRYYLQNQHHDVVALVNTSGSISERVNYDPYGSPIGTFTSIANRKGYAGYDYDAELGDTYHVRHRVYRSDLGVWTRRDPLGYVDGLSLYEYVRSRPVMLADPFGAAGRFSGTDIGEQCDPLLPCQNPAACDECRGGPGVTPNGPPDEKEPPAPGLDRAEMRCRGILLPVPAPVHCFIRCCPSDGTKCRTYSLNKDGDCARIRIDHPSDRDRDNGRPRGVRYRTVRGANLCKCLKAGLDDITKGGSCPYNYKFNSCNSNWFANAMWRCCTGQYPGAPITAPFGMDWDCCREHHCGDNCYFKCNYPDAPGQGLNYCCACAR